MILKSVFPIVLAASLAIPGCALLAPAAFASEVASAATSANSPSNPTLLWTGGRSALVTWGDASDSVSYEVTIAGGSVQRTKSTKTNSVIFDNLPLNHRYMASVVSLDASGTRSKAALTNTVALGTPPASETQATPSASTQPSSTPTQTSEPTPSATASAPSQSTSATPPAISAAPSVSAPATSQPQPSQSTGAVAPSKNDSSLISQVQPTQWGLGALVALLTFAALMLLRSGMRRARYSVSQPRN